jgi:uncharacterized protein YpmB
LFFGKRKFKIFIIFTNNIISVKGAKALLFNTIVKQVKTLQATKRQKANHSTFLSSACLMLVPCQTMEYFLRILLFQGKELALQYS